MRKNETSWRVGLWALALGGLMLAPGCGGKDEATNPPVAGGGAPSQELAAVDPADIAGYEGWLKTNGLDAPEVSLSGHRGGGSETTAWPLLPRGDVRLDGLTVWRLEVDPVEYDPEQGLVLEFRKGKNVLWRDTLPFQPEGRIVQGGLPKSVLDAVKVGDTVTWGLVNDAKPKASMLGEFKVVSKPSAAKQIDRIENDRQNARQPAKVKALGRGQALLNNSLFAEALLTYMDLAVGTGSDPIVQEAGYRIVECMRRLGLDEAPLYTDAMQLAGARKGKSQGKAATDTSAAAPTTGLAGVAPYTPSERPIEPDATPQPKPTPQPTPANRTKPTDESARRAVATVERQAGAAEQAAKEAAAYAKAQAQRSMSEEERVAALRREAAKAEGTPGEADAKRAVAAAEAAARRAAEQARASGRRAEDARQDPALMARLRELAGSNPGPEGQRDADAHLARLQESAAASAKEAENATARAGRMRAEAEAAQAAGAGNASDLRAAAEEAEARAQTARDAAAQAARGVEDALLIAGAKRKPEEQPSPAQQLAILAGWSGRLTAEAEALRAAAEASAEAAARAATQGDAEAAALRAQAEADAQAATLARQRAEAARQAYEATKSTHRPAGESR